MSVTPIYPQYVAKRLIDLDEQALGAARAELGTSTIKDTVNEALKRATRQRARQVAAALDSLAGRPAGSGRRLALTFLVDTSVLKRLGRPGVRQVVEPLAVSGQLARASVSDLEIGYTARNVEEWDRLVGALDSFDLVETSGAHVRRALQVQRLLAQASQRGRKIPDLFIAAAAEELDLIVLHDDADFDWISAVTGQRGQWVAAAGSLE